MRTGDNKEIIVPNSNITGGNITNFSAKDTRRIDMIFGIGYDDDIKKAKDILHELVENETMRRNAETLGEKIRAEDGVGNAIAILSNTLHIQLSAPKSTS